MRNVTLRQLRAVAGIAKTGKILGAADLLGVTPPAVTLQLKQLEESLRLPLFERTREGMRLTSAGDQVLGCVRRIEAALASCEEALNAMRGLKGGTVAIGAVSTAKYFAPAALGAFKRVHPEVDIQLFVGNRQETIRSLASLEFDLMIMGRPPEDIAVEMAVIGDHPHVIIAAPDHRLARQRQITIAELAGETFLTREKGSGTRSLMERLFEEGDVNPPRGMEIASNETIKQAVMAGLGIAFISAHTVGAEIEMERLVILDVAGLPILRQWHIVRHAEKRLMPAAAALWAFLQREGQAFLPSPAGAWTAAKQVAERPAVEDDIDVTSPRTEGLSVGED